MFVLSLRKKGLIFQHLSQLILNAKLLLLIQFIALLNIFDLILNFIFFIIIIWTYSIPSLHKLICSISWDWSIKFYSETFSVLKISLRNASFSSNSDDSFWYFSDKPILFIKLSDILIVQQHTLSSFTSSLMRIIEHKRFVFIFDLNLLFVRPIQFNTE